MAFNYCNIIIYRQTNNFNKKYRVKINVSLWVTGRLIFQVNYIKNRSIRQGFNVNCKPLQMNSPK